MTSQPLVTSPTTTLPPRKNRSEWMLKRRRQKLTSILHLCDADDQLNLIREKLKGLLNRLRHGGCHQMLLGLHSTNSVIYLDAGCTECFQLLGAYPLLLELGARTVCSLEDASPLDEVVNWQSYPEPAEKVVILTSRLLSDAHRYILRCLSTFQKIQGCTIFTSISEVGHSAYPDSPLGPDAFCEYESLLVQDYEELMKRSLVKSSEPSDKKLKKNPSPEGEDWSQLSSSGDEINESRILRATASHIDGFPRPVVEGDKKLVVGIHHFPLLLCPLSPRVFVLPSEGSVATAHLSVEQENSIGPGLPSISTGAPDDSEDFPPGATLTAQFIYHLATKMDLKLEIFSLGDLSKTVGKLLMDMSSLYDVGRRKRSAGLLLIDRTLDLITPSCHGDSLVDRILSSLPRKELTTSMNHVKGFDGQAKGGVLRTSLNVQLPLDEILQEESSVNNFQLLESIEAFLNGWNSGNSASQIVGLTNLSKKLDGDQAQEQSKYGEITGSLVSTDNFHGTKYLEALLERRTKDSVVLITKWLQESLRQEKIPRNGKTNTGSVSKSGMLSMIKALSKSQSSLLRNKGIIQLTAAALNALDELHSSRWDAFSSAEKILNVNAGDTSQSLAAQISDLINKSALVGSQGPKNSEATQGLLGLKDALLLAVIGYILAGKNFPTSGSGGPFSWQEEHFMQEAIIDAVIENPTIATLKFLQGLSEELKGSVSNKKSEETKEGSSQLETDGFDDDQWENWDDEDTDTKKEQVYGDMQLKLELRDRVDSLFKFLHKLSRSKNNISAEAKFSDDPYLSKGLLYQVLTRVLAKYDVPGLEYHSSAVGRLFKSGFGRFGLGQAKPSLGDQNVILIFVVGGINGVEVLEAHEALSQSSRPDIELILGGTTLLTPDDMFNQLFGDASFS